MVNWFEDLTKTVADDKLPRREVIRRLSGTAVGMLVASWLPDQALAVIGVRSSSFWGKEMSRLNIASVTRCLFLLLLTMMVSTTVVIAAPLPFVVGSITEYPIPHSYGYSVGAQDITAGSDGNLWFTESGSDKIGRITPKGKFTIYTLPDTRYAPQDITAGPDGNLWFTEDQVYATAAFKYVNKIGRISPTGIIAEYRLPISTGGPEDITAGPDGNLWFTNTENNGTGAIARITPTGTITWFPLPESAPVYITAGPDGNLWFTVYDNHIGRITPTGQLTEFLIPTGNSSPQDITAGPDGNLWFTEENTSANRIGRITPSGTFTEFPIPTHSSSPAAITSGPDGNLWFSEMLGNKIGRITPSGTISEYPIPTHFSQPWGITAGPDGNVWFVEFSGINVGKITTR